MKSSIIIPAFLPAMACTFYLGGCAATLPVALIGQHGEILRGTNTYSLGPISESGSLSVSNGKTTCSASYVIRSSKEINTTTFPIQCTDGRTGIATARWEYLGGGGGGKVRFSDGTEGDFIIGEGASRI